MDAPVETFADGETEALEDNHADQMEDVEEVVLDETSKNEEHDNEQKAAEVGDKKWPGWPGENVFRLLVPAPKVGGIIGRKGEFIKKLCEETRSRIKILENIPGAPERAVMFSAKEEPDVSVPPAMDALLRVHKRVYDGLEAESGHASSNPGTPIVTRLLVAGTQAGSLIGRQGTTIKSIQEGSSCTVRILEDVPACALLDDRVVEIQGDPAGMHKAVELIASQLRKFLVDRSVITLFENSMSAPHPHMEPSMPHQPWGHPQPGPYPGAGGPGFGGNPQYMAPPRQFDNYHPPVDHPHVEKLPSHQVVSAYGRDMPHGHAVPAAAPVQSIITQVTQHMQIPLAYADAVIGAAGSSISYIRRASGATITIQETRGIPGEMTVEISGSASQVQTAQQLIQNFMAEAAAPAQNQMNSVDPSYNSYQSHNTYSAPANTGPPGHPSGGYGSVYSGNYGY